MKNLILVLSIICLMNVNKAQAQSCPIPEPLDKSLVVGTWQGNYLENGIVKPVKIRITNNGLSLKSEIALGSVNFKTVETFLCPREDLHLTLTDNGKPIEFRGKPINGKLTGNFFYMNSQNNRVSDSCTLTKQ